MVLAFKPGLTRTDYVSEAVFQREYMQLASKSMIVVARSDELQRPGAYVAIEPWGERIVVVRGRDLVLRGFVDRCAHRAVPLTLGDRGLLSSAGLACPYHGATYTDAGHAHGLPLFRGLYLEPRQIIERWGHVFVALGARTSTATYLDMPPAWFCEAQYASLALVHRHTYRTAANWKLIVENFQESLHFPRVHATLNACTPHGLTTSIKLGPHWFGGTMQLAAGTQTVAPSGKRAGRCYVAGAGWRKHVYDAFLFPLWLTSLQPDYFLTYRIIPLAPDLTEIQADIYGHVVSVGSGSSAWSEVVDFWAQVNDEDRAIVERQMHGVQSPSFMRMNLSLTEEAGLVSFAKAYRAGMRPAKRVV